MEFSVTLCTSTGIVMYNISSLELALLWLAGLSWIKIGPNFCANDTQVLDQPCCGWQACPGLKLDQSFALMLLKSWISFAVEKFGSQ